MLNTVDLYLGVFLIVCGFALSLLNLRRILQNRDTKFSTVLLSENLMLLCIGLAFVSRSIFESSSVDMVSMEIVEKSFVMSNKQTSCSFVKVLLSYGPLIVSLVNSFLSLIIDNYMHYKMVEKTIEKENENNIQEINLSSSSEARTVKVNSGVLFLKKYFNYIAIFIQWLLPIAMVFAMYPMGVKEDTLKNKMRSFSDNCMTLLNIDNSTCDSVNELNTTLELRNYIPVTDYWDNYQNDLLKNNKSEHVDKIVSNIFNIISNLNKNTSLNVNVTSPYLFRISKSHGTCMKMCYLENKSMVLYMFVLAVVSYFVPITISTILLTKIHMMEVKKSNSKTYVTRELLYNILFWTPVMFDTFLSLTLCSYSMNGMRTSLFNVIANIYQAIKNFMNTKYFSDNTIVPM